MKEAEDRLFHMTGLWWLLLFALSIAGMLCSARYSTLAAEQETTVSADLQVSAPDAGRVYRMRVVIDPMAPEANGTDVAQTAEETETTAGELDDDVTLAVAVKVAAALADSDILVRLTRKDTAVMSVEERVSLTERLGADYYICLGESSSQEAEDYGISGFYNAEYFIAELGNAELADLLVRSVTVAASDRAVGLYAAEEGSVLTELSIPAAQVNLGYVTNDTEYTLMRQDAYQDKLARGIADVLLALLEDETE